MRASFTLTMLLALLLGGAAAPSPSALAVTIGGVTRQFDSRTLLARRDAATLTVPHDVSYGRSMTYRAIPLRGLLAAFAPDPADTIEVRATDGFVAQIPRSLLEGDAIPWIAIEDPARPWPSLPRKTISAGPFYLIWQNPERGGISPEQWPYAMAALSAVPSPGQRWPEMRVADSLPADAPARSGQAAYVTHCLACHRLAGSGEGNVGPDLLRPVPATSYLSHSGLRALIRDPRAVRNWPDQRMPAFDPEILSDSDIDAIVAYLQHLDSRLH